MQKRSWRLIILIAIFLLMAASLMGRLFYLQIISHKYYSALALGQQTGFNEIKGSRGEVFLQNSQDSKGAQSSGEIKSLAINKEVWTLGASVQNIKDKEAFAEAVGAITNTLPAVILEKISNTENYVVLKKEVTPTEVVGLRALAVGGIDLQSSLARYYPQESLASQLIGFVGGGDGTGQYGLEGFYEDELKGKMGIQEEKRGFDIISIVSGGQSLNGTDLYLTIDYNIQFQAESLLQEAAQKLSMASGQILVIKPDSGRILALANYPSFNPNEYGRQTDYGIFQNSAVQKIFEPGYIFKPFTMAVALNEGKITPDATFIDTGSVKIGPAVIYNFDRKVYGVSDMSRVLEKSINTGAVWISQQIPHDTFVNYLGEFGFNQKTGVDVQGEVYSRNDILKTGSATGFATASFGQGIEMTPVQLAAAFSMFANGGKVVTPYVVEKMVSGGQEQKAQPNISGQVISAKTAEQVTKMMINVVERGFGDIARIPGYYLAGKTGTAQVSYEDKKGYYPDKTIQSFIGFGPALKPEFLILVKLDDPKVPTSSLSAAPIFGKLAQFIINYWQIPPDY